MKIVFIFLLVASSLNAKAVCENYLNCSYELPVKNKFFTYFSSHSLTTLDRRIDRLVIVVHGAGRNGNDYFNDTVQAAKKIGVEKKTIILAPTFRKVTDQKKPNEIYWGKNWFEKWKYGYLSQDETKTSSFTIIDSLVKSVALSGTFPNLREVVITGHSAGGQFTQRYAFGTEIDLVIPQKLTIIPSNPSSYLYLDDIRYTFQNGNFESLDQSQLCHGFNEYIYGPKNRAKYLEKFDLEALRLNFKRKNLVFLMSEEDKGEDSLDRTCEAMTQGQNRIERAQNFYHYSKKFLPSKSHLFSSIPLIGHDHVAVYESDQAREFVFGIPSVKDSSYLLNRYGSIHDFNVTTQTIFTLLGGGKNEAIGLSNFIAAARGGDLLIVSGKDRLEHRYIFDFNRLAQQSNHKLNSISVVSFLNRTAAEKKNVLALLEKADAIFFTGGDQSKYIDRIKGSSFHKKLISKVQSGLPVSGTSAGLAIMGEFIFSAQRGGVSSRYVLQNPLSEAISIEHDFFYHPFLSGIITDTHFSERQREGRLLGFMYKTLMNFNLKSILGIGIDEQTSLTINPDKTIIAFGKGDVFVYKANSNLVYRPSPLNMNSIKRKSLQRGDAYLDLHSLSYDDTLSVVDGRISSP